MLSSFGGEHGCRTNLMGPLPTQQLVSGMQEPHVADLVPALVVGGWLRCVFQCISGHCRCKHHSSSLVSAVEPLTFLPLSFSRICLAAFACSRDKLKSRALRTTAFDPLKSQIFERSTCWCSAPAKATKGLSRRLRRCTKKR